MGLILAPRQIGRRQPGMELSGGQATQTYSSGGTNYRSVTFTASGQLTVAGKAGIVEIMSIGGGGGGATGGDASQAPGGGGGGSGYSTGNVNTIVQLDGNSSQTGYITFNKI